MAERRRLMNVDEALLYLENHEVSDSYETEDENETDYVARGELVILPPAEQSGEESGEDSGDENEQNPNKLSRQQLLAEATLSLNTTATSQRSNDWESSDEEPLSNAVSSQSKQSNASPAPKKRCQRKKKADPPAKWRNVDSVKRSQLNQWNEPDPKFDKNLQPHQIFEMFLTEEEMERICLESEAYARQKGDHVFEMTIEKLKSFLAILLLSGYNVLPRQEMYWERQEDSHNRLAASLLSKNEFENCKKYLHLCNNNDLNPTDRFAKVRPLFDSINETFLANYQPSQHVSIDESMVPYFGRHGAKQYIHGKPIKFGYKLWVMASPLGYCIQFRPYAGKDTILQEYNDIGLGLGASVVAHLTESLPEVINSHYHVVTDNFFTSPKLLRYLKSKGIAATGTVRVNRMENAPLKDMKVVQALKRGSSDVVTDISSNITAVRWKDNKVVNCLSTFTGKEPIQSVKRFCHKEKKKVDIEQPNIIREYNKSMGGVDRMDQNIAAYMVNLRSKKWWWPLFRFVLDASVNNAYQLYRMREIQPGEKKLDALGFRRAIVLAYFNLYRKETSFETLFRGSRKLHNPAENLRYDGWNHWLIKGSQRRCAMEGCRGTSKYFCEKCNVGLHPDCHKVYHTC